MRPTPLTLGTLTRSSIRHYWRISLAVAVGVATATAVITGALLVGDSMRGSLADLTTERLGLTESMVAPMSFFDAEGVVPDSKGSAALVYFPTGSAEFKSEFKSPQPATDASTGDAEPVFRRAGSIQIIGVDPDFWSLDSIGVRPTRLPDDNSIVLNDSAAQELGVQVGDRVTVRLPAEQAVPADSPLGRRDIMPEGLPRMEVVEIIQDRGLGRFSLIPSQEAPKNIYLSRSVIGDVLDRAGQANLLLLDRELTTPDLDIDIDDLGLDLRRVSQQFDGQVVFDYYTLTSDRLLVPDLVVDEVISELGSDNAAPITTYLANAIERVDESGTVLASIPYSTITALESSDDLPLNFDLPPESNSANSKKLSGNAPVVIPLVINDWAAEQLDAKVGTPLRIAYYEPEVENGKEIERYFDAVVTQVVPITQPNRPYRRRRGAQFSQPPTVYNDPDLTPLVPGVTDQDSISDWDLPFPLKRKINRADDDYWNNYRLTPKAFLPLEDGRRLFGSRFGETTSLRIDASVADDAESLKDRISERLSRRADELGWDVIPIRQQQLAASKGTTPFDGLFLALSFFVIAAAVLLIAMLMRLGLIQRTQQLGTLLAIGWTPKRTRRLLMAESASVSGVGAIAGVAGGCVYAWAVLWALRTTWVGAVTAAFLRFHYSPVSLVLGLLVGWFTAMVTLWITTRWMSKVSARQLLSGSELDSISVASRGSVLPKVAWGIAGFGVCLGLLGAISGGQAAAGGFIGGGMALLVAGQLMIFDRLQVRRKHKGSIGDFSIRNLAGQNASRRPLRSTMTIALMATASFLIVAISAFRLQPTQRGTGGFELMATTTQPVYVNLRDKQAREELLGRGPTDLNALLPIAMRMRLGQDASCNNLYQANQPTVIGVPSDFADVIASESTLVGFDWAKAAPSLPETQSLPETLTPTESPANASPWRRLSSPAAGTASDPIPVVIDQNTAMWSLQMTGGIGQVKSFQYQAGEPTFFQVVGLLSNSVLQGKLLIGEANFTTAFPNISGYQFFLFDVPPDQVDTFSSAIETELGDVGMDVSRSADVLAGMLAVQNTYLRTFQSLGALGLLLGTVGLAVAQVRSVIERRSEFAVLRSVGFTKRRLGRLVMTETAWLLLMGIGCGVLCAAVSVLPHAWISGTRPLIVEPALTVIAIMLFGMAAGLLAVRQISGMKLIDSLRAQ